MWWQWSINWSARSLLLCLSCLLICGELLSFCWPGSSKSWAAGCRTWAGQRRMISRNKESLNYVFFQTHPTEDAPHFIWLIAVLMASCVHLIILCFCGSLLAGKTDQLSFNVYESNWPDMSPKFKSTMSIVLEVTKEPINIFTTWNLFIIALPTFLRVSVIANWNKLQMEINLYSSIYFQVACCAHSMLSFLKGMEQ